MMEKPTVFVLGAGASMPYGYPSGVELRDRICTEFIPDLERFRNRDKVPSDLIEEFMDKMNEFVNSFRNSRIQSIDQWLAFNPQFSEIGKLAISNSIIKCENPDKLLFENRNKSSDWFTILYNEIIKRTNKPGLSLLNLAFISFNYDRLLEHLFYESFKHTFTNIASPTINESLAILPIIHVYGCVDSPPWRKEKGYQYGQQYNFSFVNKARNCIRVIGERTDHSLQNAHSLLQNADRVFFLGFGYDAQNLATLMVSDFLPKVPRIYGTAKGFFDNEIIDVLNKTKTHTATIERCDSVELLRKYFIGQQ